MQTGTLVGWVGLLLDDSMYLNHSKRDLTSSLCVYVVILCCDLGALYPDGTSGRNKSDDAVPPNKSYTYTWMVKPEYSPTEADSSCLTWIYHSHSDAPRDIASGLIGALLTCKKGNRHEPSNKQFSNTLQK